MQSNVEIDMMHVEAFTAAREANSGGTAFPGCTYEEGVRNALAWVICPFHNTSPLIPDEPEICAEDLSSLAMIRGRRERGEE